ncbi:Rieske (2Fe-2S) protein [Microlunatus antarcticus]|uniref:Cytochrome bc1 complex Rieske iron-sulfur subunit n=1 Tax=Microlunatus antarcticus TaxID=53388 RepID=A0A7W5JXQ0_9ACTN|nr:Rieske (2Fe-2S) protein [Microlunatus antarcticus]MBB3328173.1 Rieske Fe-S protein [Microlunatus antarcticus]
MTSTTDRTASPTDPASPGGPSRRAVLRTAGLVTLSGGAVLTLAACGAEGQAGDPVPTSAAPSTSAASPSASSSASASESPSEAASSKAPSGPSVATADVPVGGGVILDDADYVITQPTKGTYKAFSKICTHQGCKVGSVSGGVIICPCHKSEFSIEDGSVKQPPASKPLAESATTVSGSKVYVTG